MLNSFKYDMLHDKIVYIIYVENIVTFRIDWLYAHLPFLHHVLFLYAQYFMYIVQYNLKNTSLQPTLLSTFQS